MPDAIESTPAGQARLQRYGQLAVEVGDRELAIQVLQDMQKRDLAAMMQLKVEADQAAAKARETVEPKSQ